MISFMFQSSAVNFNYKQLNNVIDPVSAQQGATKTYVNTTSQTSIGTTFKVLYISPAGSDTTGMGSILRPYATLGKAQTIINGTGWELAIMPGTYTENVTFTAQNFTMSAVVTETGGIVNINGTLTLNHPASSVQVNDVSVGTLVCSGAGSHYLQNVNVGTALTLSGGYSSIFNCSTQGTGGITISGTSSRVFNGGYIGAITVNAGTPTVSVSNTISCYPIVQSVGTLVLGIGSIYAATGTSNALSSTGTGSVVILDGATFLTPANTNDRVNIGTGVIYQIISAEYDKANSVFNGTLSVINPIYYQMSDPTLAQKPTTKNYVDTKYLAIDGTSTMTGNLNMGNKNINNLLDPTCAQQGATKNYVDTLQLCLTLHQALME